MIFLVYLNKVNKNYMDQQTNTPDFTNNISEEIRENKFSGGNYLLNAHDILKNIIGLQNGQIVGDLGAGGAAYFTLQAAKLVGDQGQVYAVDILKNVLSSINSKAQMAGLYNIKTVWSNLEIYGATKIPEASLDHAFIINVLFQSKKDQDIIKEAIRLLKPGGQLSIIDWSDMSPSFAPNQNLQLAKNDIIEMAQNLSLSLKQEFQAGAYHFGLIFIK